MPETVRIGVLRREPPSEMESREILRKYPDQQVEFVPIEPNSPQETCDMIKNLNLDAVLLRRETLVDQALREDTVPLIMPDEEGNAVVRLLGVNLDTEQFSP